MKSPRIVSDPEILGGTPVFVGTRVPIRILFEHLEAGDSLKVFLEDFRSVSRELAIQCWKTPKLCLSPMRILLDESVAGRLGSLLTGHTSVTVQRRGWTSIQNGRLLALAAGEFDVLLTADKGMAYQQNLGDSASCNSHRHCAQQPHRRPGACSPAILAALAELPPRTLRKIAA